MEPARYVGLAFAAAAMLVSLYMAGLASSDWLARRTLSGDDATRYAAKACEQIPGCEKLALEPGYDWQTARRRVIYRVALKPGADRGRIDGILAYLAVRERGVLGWTLRAEAKLDLRGGAAKPPNKPAPKRGQSAKGGVR